MAMHACALKNVIYIITVFCCLSVDFKNRNFLRFQAVAAFPQATVGYTTGKGIKNTFLHILIRILTKFMETLFLTTLCVR